MRLDFYDSNVSFATYNVEIYSALDVAENGINANVIKFTIPKPFNFNDENDMSFITEKIKPIVEEHGFDTVTISKSTYEERYYNVIE